MDKLHHFLALLQVALILGACANDAPEWGGSEVGDKTTSMRFEVRVSADDTGTRAVSQTEEGGTKNERSVSSMTVLFNNMPAKYFTANLDKTKMPKVKSPVFEVNTRDVAGINQMTVVLNGNGIPFSQLYLDKNKVIKLSDFDKLVDTSEGVDKFKDFMMTATVAEDENFIEEGEINPDANEYFVENGIDNNFSLDVERVLSKVQVRRSETLSLTGDMAKGTIKVDELKYALAGSAKEAYLFRDFTGLENKIVDNEYPFYESKIHSKEVASTWKGTDEHPFLQRVSDNMEGGAKKNFEAKSVDVKDATKSTTNGIYFLENSTNQNIKERNQLEYNRIAYVKIYGTFVPNKAMHYDKGTSKFTEVSELPGGTRSFTVVTDLNNPDYDRDRALYQSLLDELGGEEDADDPADMWIVWNTYPSITMKDPPGTFYLGLKDGIIYDTLLGALKAGNGYENVYRYVGGKMVWLAPVNAQIVGEGNDAYVKNADTRRNNIYDLTISSINGFGLPYDPVDPYDPNIPKKDNPYDATPDSHIKVDPLTQLVRIHASILKWNIQELNYDF